MYCKHLWIFYVLWTIIFVHETLWLQNLHNPIRLNQRTQMMCQTCYVDQQDPPNHHPPNMLTNRTQPSMTYPSSITVPVVSFLSHFFGCCCKEHKFCAVVIEKDVALRMKKEKLTVAEGKREQYACIGPPVKLIIVGWVFFKRRLSCMTNMIVPWYKWLRCKGVQMLQSSLKFKFWKMKQEVGAKTGTKTKTQQK